MDEDIIEVLRRIEIPSGDDRRHIEVRIERRTTHHGKDRTFVNAVLQIGSRKVYIPRRNIADVGRALLESHADAEQAYCALLEESNRR